MSKRLTIISNLEQLSHLLECAKSDSKLTDESYAQMQLLVEECLQHLNTTYDIPDRSILQKVDQIIQLLLRLLDINDFL